MWHQQSGIINLNGIINSLFKWNYRGGHDTPLWDSPHHASSTGEALVRSQWVARIGFSQEELDICICLSYRRRGRGSGLIPVLWVPDRLIHMDGNGDSCTPTRILFCMQIELPLHTLTHIHKLYAYWDTDKSFIHLLK